MKRAKKNRVDVRVLRHVPGNLYVMGYMRDGEPKTITVEATSNEDAIEKFHQLDAVARLSAPLSKKEDILFREVRSNRSRRNPETPEWASKAAIAKSIAARIHERINSAQDFLDSDLLSEAFGAVLGAHTDFLEARDFGSLDELPQEGFGELVDALNGLTNEMYERLEDFTKQKREIDRRIAADLFKYVASNPSHIRKSPRKVRKWTDEDAAAFAQERGPVDALFDHLLSWFGKTSDGEHLIIFSNGDYRWIQIHRPKKSGLAYYSWSSPLNKTPKAPQKRKADGLYADLLADKSVVASIWTSISGDGLRFFCEFLLKKKPSLAKKFAAAKGLNTQSDLLVENYRTLTEVYPIDRDTPSRKERTLKSR